MAAVGLRGPLSASSLRGVNQLQRYLKLNCPVLVPPHRRSRLPSTVAAQYTPLRAANNDVRDYDGNYGAHRNGNGYSTTTSTASAPSTSTSDVAAIEEAMMQLTEPERATIRLFQEHSPCVVNISTTSTALGLFPPSAMRIPRGVGSGFIWDNRAHVITNCHVIQNAEEVKVTLFDQSSYSAKVIGKDREKDIAVLQLEMPPSRAAQLRPVQLGSSSSLLVGQRVYAIGNPFGLDQTLTQGIVSGLNRELPVAGMPIKGVIQTDAAINPGNSGGPLLDSRGRLVGINTAILDPTGVGISSGVGFAIPIDATKGLVEQILKYGRVVRPALGISIASPMVMRQLNRQGVLVAEVLPEGPAARAGLQGSTRGVFGWQLGDIIVGMKGKKVKDAKDLFAILDECRVGDVVEVTVERGSSTRTMRITLQERQKMSAFE